MTKNKGFTLLETLIAIGILVLVGGVAVGASVRAINTGTFSKDRTLAQDLARRQIEGLKALRDKNLKAGQDWNQGFKRECPGGGYVVVEQSQEKISFVCDGGQDISWPESTGYHVLTKIEAVADDINGDDNGGGEGTKPQNGYPNLDEGQNMASVRVSVSWEEGFLAQKQEVEVLSYLTNNQIGN